MVPDMEVCGSELDWASGRICLMKQCCRGSFSPADATSWLFCRAVSPRDFWAKSVFYGYINLANTINYALTLEIVCVWVCVCAQPCPTLCDPTDCSPPGSSVHGIFQARKMEWVVISSSRRFSWPRDRMWVSCVLHWEVDSLPLSLLRPLIDYTMYIKGLLRAMALHSSTLAWKVPWTEEPVGLQSMGSLGHDWATSLSLFTFMHWRRKWQPTPVFLPGESQGRGNLVGCRLWGRTESDTTEVT